MMAELTNITTREDNNTSTSNEGIVGMDPLLIQAVTMYKRARVGNEIHKYWFAFSCPIGLLSIRVNIFLGEPP